MLKTRIFTALFLLAVFAALFLVLTPDQFVWGLILVVLLAAWEWGRLCFSRRNKPAIIYGLVIAGVLLSAWPIENLRRPMIIFGALMWCLSPILMAKWHRKREVPVLTPLMGVFVLVPAFFAIATLRYSDSQTGYFLWVLLLLVWCADIGAYFSGKSFGSRKLAPNISPGKTWEGFWGGLICASLIGVAVIVLFPIPGLSVSITWLAVCLITAAFSVLGDLTESLVKRMAGVKDSSALLPGHGGVLDRLDGVLAAAPVFSTFLWMIELLD